MGLGLGFRLRLPDALLLLEMLSQLDVQQVVVLLIADAKPVAQFRRHHVGGQADIEFIQALCVPAFSVDFAQPCVELSPDLRNLNGWLVDNICYSHFVTSLLGLYNIYELFSDPF